MLREKISDTHNKEKFRHRGVEIARIETLSDAVFGFSVSLLVASLEVPQTFDELRLTINGALPFFATVAMLFMFWYKQYIYFRHYSINDFVSILLNLTYLAVILFYLYPMKFLFSFLLTWWSGINLFPRAVGKTVMRPEEMSKLVIPFSIGYFVIFMLLYIMYQRALLFSKRLQLSKYELLFTKKERRGFLMQALIGAFAVFNLICKTRADWLSGVCYLFIPVFIILNEALFKRELKKARA